jgi:endonuclease-3
MQTAGTIATILDRLRDRYGEPARHASGDPVGGLVETILSQSTSDTNSRRAYQSLRSAFSTWNDVLDADVEEVAEAIRCGGLADQKAPTIQRALGAIKDRDSCFGGDVLDDLDDEAAMAWLQGIRGVGQKTAACVLLFDLERDVLPVDTHVHRLSRRLGLVPDSAPAGRTQLLLEEQIAPEDRYAAHVLFITHGRVTCHARKPNCRTCDLNDLCPSCHLEKRVD